MKTIEKKLSDAVNRLIPEDMYSRIEKSVSSAGYPTTKKDEENYMNKKTKSITKWMSAAAAACLLAAFGLFGGIFYANNMAVDTVVDIDVNPSIQISTNKKDVVLKVDALNSDGEAVLDGMNLKNADIKVAVNAIIGSMVRCGYLTDADNGILVSVHNEDTNRALGIRNEILADIDSSLRENHIEASVINQTVTDTGTAAEFAKKHGISTGKAVFVLGIAEKEPAFNADELASLSLREIAELVVRYGVDISGFADYDRDDGVWENIADIIDDINESTDASIPAAPEGAITPEQAEQVALEHAGLTGGGVVYIKTELEKDDGVWKYEIEFYANGIEYEYDIDAMTGNILRHEKDADDGGNRPPQTETTPPATTTPAQLIDTAEAKAAALAHAGVNADDAIFVKAELDRDDGVWKYEIEFIANGNEYEYDIDALTGAVTEYDVEPADHGDGHGPHSTVPSPTQQAEEFIGESRAKEIALERAGITTARFEKVELDKDDGVWVYEIEFYADGIEYECKINAITGKIREFGSEKDD